MTSLSKLQEDWRLSFEQLTKEKSALQQQRAPLAEQVAAFNAVKPDGMWSKLGRAFKKSTSIASVNRKVRKLDGKINDCDAGILARATDTYRQMGESALNTLTNGQSFRENYAVLQETRGMLRETDQVIVKAIDDCGSASTTKMFDSFSDNKLLSVVSFFQTRHATKTIANAQAALQGLEKKLEQAPKISADLGADISFNNNFSLILDMLGGLGGSFSDIMGSNQLDRAADQLRGVSQKLGSVDGEIQKGMNNILSMSISVMRRNDALMDGLAQEIAPHLPAADAESMKPPKQKFSL